MFLVNGVNDSTTMNNNIGVKSRTATMTSIGHHERTSSMISEVEHHRRDSQALLTGNHLPLSSLASHIDDKENRRLIDIQCKIKTKETGLCVVKHVALLIEILLCLSIVFLFIKVIH
jgi:hypothetical protein